MSKPVYSPLSPTYPYGGKSASNPTIKVFFFDPHEQRAMQKSPIANASDIILTTDFSMLDKRSNLYRAFKESEKMQTPWFLGQYIWEYCEKQILKTLKSHKYYENGGLYE